MLNFTVGPVMSDEQVLEISSHSAPYFRTPEFSTIMLENEARMLKLMKAPEGSRCVFLTASGTGAMEAIVMHVLNEQDKVLVVNGGSFGQRFVDLCKMHNRAMTEIRVPFGCQLKREQLEEYRGKQYTALLINMHETSSGVLYDMPMIADFCKEQGIALLVDAISAFVTDEVLMDEWNLTAVITGSQKALAVHPGVSVVVLTPDAVKRVEENSELCMYLSLKSALKNAERGQTPFTPAVTTLLQIHTRLREIEENGGIEKERDKIKERAAAFRESISDLPLSIISESCSNAVTALHPLKNNAKEIVQHLKEDYQIWVCPNGGEKADEVFRVGHFGFISENDNRALISALHDLYRRKIL